MKLYKADDRTRTDNLLITNQLLCQLSHIGKYYALASAPPGARTPHTLIKSQVLYQMS